MYRMRIMFTHRRPSAADGPFQASRCPPQRRPRRNGPRHAPNAPRRGDEHQHRPAVHIERTWLTNLIRTTSFDIRLGSLLNAPYTQLHRTAGESVKPLQYFCSALPMSYLIHQRKLSFWKKRFVVLIIIVSRPSSHFVYNCFILISSIYDLQSPNISNSAKAQYEHHLLRQLTYNFNVFVCMYVSLMILIVFV